MFVIQRRCESTQDLQHYSNLTRLLRIISCRSFFKRFSSAQDSLTLIPSELRESLLYWTRYSQGITFAGEIRKFSNGEPLQKLSRLSPFSPFIDKEELLRVGGHLDYIKIKNTHIFCLLNLSWHLSSDDAHKRSLHGGIQLTLSQVRECYWIIGGRAPVRSYILRVICYSLSRLSCTTTDGTVTCFSI